MYHHEREPTKLTRRKYLIEQHVRPVPVRKQQIAMIAISGPANFFLSSEGFVEGLIRKPMYTCDLEVRVPVSRVDGLKSLESQQVEDELDLVCWILAGTPFIEISPDWDFAIGTQAVLDTGDRVVAITHRDQWFMGISVGVRMRECV